MKQAVYSLFIFLAFIPSLSGQNKIKTPYSFSHPLDQEIPTYTLTPQFKVMSSEQLSKNTFTLDTLEGDELIIDNPTIGELFPIDIDIHTDGKWYALENGDSIWQMKVVTLTGNQMLLVFEQFYLPEGVSLFLYSEDKKQVLGAFTNENNTSFKRFTSLPLTSNTMVLELYKPSHVNQKVELKTESVGLIMLDFISSNKNMTKKFGESKDGNNVNCLKDTYICNLQRSVVLIGTIDSETNTIGVCSGALINNPKGDGKPFLLTARHCTNNNEYYAVSDEEAKKKVRDWIFIFNYESPDCENPQVEPSKSNYISGATFLKGSQTLSNETDYVLLLLDKMPPKEFNAYYSGWSVKNTFSSPGICIHHAKSDIKKFAFLNKLTNLFNTTYWLFDKIGMVGTIQSGSSGAPVFNSSGLIGGQILGSRWPSGNILVGCFDKSYHKFGLKGIINPNNIDIKDLPGMNLSKENWYFNNETNLHTSENNEESGSRRHNGVYSAKNNIITQNNVIIQPNTNVIFEAENQIILKSGFCALSGSRFRAVVEAVPYGCDYPVYTQSMRKDEIGDENTMYEESELSIQRTVSLHQADSPEDNLKDSSSNPIQRTTFVNQPDIITDDLIDIYPNPNKGEFCISLPASEQKVRVQIINTSGNVILEKEYIHLNTLSIPSPVAGYYIIQIQMKDKVVRKQIIIR